MKRFGFLDRAKKYLEEAGMAFSNALLGIVHSMAHKTGAVFADYGAHIIHGAANAIYHFFCACTLCGISLKNSVFVLKQLRSLALNLKC